VKSVFYLNFHACLDSTNYSALWVSVCFCEPSVLAVCFGTYRHPGGGGLTLICQKTAAWPHTCRCPCWERPWCQHHVLFVISCLANVPSSWLLLPSPSA